MVEHRAVRLLRTAGSAIAHPHLTEPSGTLAAIRDHPLHSAMEEAAESHERTILGHTASARPRHHVKDVRISASILIVADTATTGPKRNTKTLKVHSTMAVLTMTRGPPSPSRMRIQTTRLPFPTSASIYAHWRNQDQMAAVTANVIKLVGKNIAMVS